MSRKIQVADIDKASMEFDENSKQLVDICEQTGRSGYYICRSTIDDSYIICNIDELTDLHYYG